MDVDVVIGLEIHAELKTKTKVFCSCENSFGNAPNTNVCPVCTGMPGALPIINKHAVELCIKAGLLFGCEINHLAIMERKNYFYPDLSKAYQISQLLNPICLGGGITLSNGEFKALNRIHLEEDAGKLVHVNKEVGTLIDYNRGGTPLIEIVTEPVFKNAEEVVEFMKIIRERLIFSDIADCKMEEGGLRCDVNISIKPKGVQQLGTRTEMKNLNSFKSVTRAINFEVERQLDILERGGEVIRQTRKWDDDVCENFPLRDKEEAQDYRYFPDPDILHIKITDEDVARIKATIDKLPDERRANYVSLGIPSKDAELLTQEKVISDYFESGLKIYDNPKNLANWIINCVLADSSVDDTKDIIKIEDLIYILKLCDDKKLTRTNALLVLEKIKTEKLTPDSIIKKYNLISDTNDQEIVDILNSFKKEYPDAVNDYKTDKKVMSFIVGYVMKKTNGKADGKTVCELINKMF